MSDTLADSPPPPEPAAPPLRKRGVAWLAWVVILLVVGFELLWPHVRPARGRAGGQDTARRVLADIQVRQIVGWGELFDNRPLLYVEAKKSMDTGPVADRLRFLVVAGELQGPGEALTQLGQLEEQIKQQGIEPTDEQRAVMEALAHLYRDRTVNEALVATAAVSGLVPPEGQPWPALGSVAAAATWTRAEGGHPPPSLTDADRELLRQELGWSGELALTPPDDPDRAARARVIAPARRLAKTFATVLGSGLVLGLFGLIGLIVWFAFFLTGRLRPALPPATRHGGIYAEAFAVYMVVFLGLSVARALLPLVGPEMLVGGLAMLLSLAAGLTWPVLRGIPWAQVREEVGLTLGRHPLLQPVIGLAGYALILPVFGIGAIVSVVLVSVQRSIQLGDRPEEHFSPVETPSHPIVEWLQHPDWRLLLQVTLLACVLAPLVEETMFRGVLYRHLRNATARLGRTSSFLISAYLVSLLFAVIHPQGLLAVPALLALAFGLTLLREWRGSLLPSMMVHGIHNGLTTFVLVQALRS
ncbi:MAG TPA: type II CAAX endopeptidase family protein [Gemmataceae bacterium]|nr:type II CAAX endopeptidase family protein [Gemmataceae bacterium]